MIDTTHIPVYDTIKRTVFDTIKIYTLQPAENNTELIIVLCSLATILAIAIITWVSNWLVNRQKYKNEYYIKVINKRFEAYNKVENIINTLRTEMFLNGKPIYHKVFHDWERYEKFYDDIVETGKYTYWLDSEIDNIFIGLNMYLIDNIPPADLKEGVCSDYGKEHHDNINLIYEELEELLIRDLKNLHKLRAFFRQKVRNNERLVLRREEPE
jgi:hypothetical protein